MPNEKSGAKNHNVICFWSLYFSFSGTGSIILKGLKVATVVIFQTNGRSYKKGVLHKCFQKTESKSGLSMNLSVTFLDFYMAEHSTGYMWPWSKSPLLDPKLLQGWFQHRALQRGMLRKVSWDENCNLCVRRGPFKRKSTHWSESGEVGPCPCTDWSFTFLLKGFPLSLKNKNCVWKLNGP